MASNEEILSPANKWRAEWTASPALQLQYISADSYAEEMAKRARAQDSGAANSEAQRRAEIDAMALPGHEALIAKLKADPSVTVGQAALRIVAAEKKRIGG